MKCGLSTFHGENSEGVTWARFRCHLWRCERCAPKKLKRLTKDAILGRPTAMLTLTVNPLRYDDKNQAARDLVVSFRRMREAIQKQKGIGAIPFLAVFEETKAGWPHLHILWRAPYVSQKWISQYMKRRTDAPIVDISRVKSRKHAAAYVSKYLSKAPRAWQGCKRWWRNSEYIVTRKVKNLSDKVWTLQRISLDDVIGMLEDAPERRERSHIEAVIIPTDGPPGYVYA